MALSPKNKRKISVGDVPYLWWVRPDEDAMHTETRGVSLHVAPADGTFLVRFPLGQPDSSTHIVVEKGAIRGLKARGTYGRYRCPEFSPGEAVRPADVGALIEWCTTAGAAVEVNYLGLEADEAP